MQLVSNTPHTPPINYARGDFSAVLGGYSGGRGGSLAVYDFLELVAEAEPEDSARLNRFSLALSFDGGGPRDEHDLDVDVPGEVALVA